MEDNAIIFILHNNAIGTDQLRGLQIINGIKYNKVVNITQCIENTWELSNDFFNEIAKFKNSIFIWVWTFENLEKGCQITKLNNNINIYDPIDNYLYKKDQIDIMLNNNLVDCLIVNNEFMKKDIYTNTCFKGHVETIGHHYDERLLQCELKNQNILNFGYAGSLASLNHTDNFLYYQKLIRKYKIEFLDTESGLIKTTNIYDNYIVQPTLQTNVSNMIINFNCHISIRKLDSNVSKYKTNAKIATAAALNHNIITTYEESLKDILPYDYPFLLHSDDYETVDNMFNTVLNDYYGSKILWNRGLEIMQQVKEKLHITNILKQYENLCDMYK